MTAKAETLVRRRHVALVVPSAVPVVAAVAIPLLMAASWIVADALQPSSYDPVLQTESVAAGFAGHDRWIMTGGLFVVGALYLVVAATADALRATGRVGLALAGASAIGIAASPQPVGGTTLRHAVFATVGAVVIAAWPAAARGTGTAQPWLLRPLPRATVTAVSVAGALWLAFETRDGALLGLAERVVTTAQVCWPAAVLLALRGSRPQEGST